MTQTTSTPNVEADTFNMFRLSAITGLTPRTIRYYIAKGLCPKPYGQRRGAYYDRTHVVALMELKRRKEQGYRLSELKASKADGEPLPERAVEDLPAHEAHPPARRRRQHVPRRVLLSPLEGRRPLRKERLDAPRRHARALPQDRALRNPPGARTQLRAAPVPHAHRPRGDRLDRGRHLQPSRQSGADGEAAVRTWNLTGEDQHHVVQRDF